MFTCQNCGTVSQPGDRPTFVMVATRKHHHPERQYTTRRSLPILEPGVVKGRRITDPGGVGPQIVKELKVCRLCAITAPTPIERSDGTLPTPHEMHWSPGEDTMTSYVGLADVIAV